MGLWGGLVPFVGPYFHFALGPDKSWTWTTGRFWLSVLPAAVAVLGGLMLLGAGPRPAGKLGALLALAAGLWFAIGPQVSLLWNASGAQGAAHGATGVRVLEMLTYHTLLGSLMAALAGYALPGLVTRRVPAGETAEAAPAEATATRVGPATAVEEAHTRTAVTDRQAIPDRPAAEDGAEPATNGGAADERPANVTSEPNGSSRTAAATAPPTTSAAAPPATSAAAPVTMRRRRGGLLSILRR
jgi:hypothetical protein